MLAQSLSYAAFLAATILAKTDAQKDALAGFITGIFVARIPILLFQAVQAALLPKLAALAGAGRHDEFRTGMRRLLLIVVGLGVVGTLGGLTLGPTAGRLLFKDWSLRGVDLALLAAGSGAFILALTLNQGLIALASYARAAGRVGRRHRRVHGRRWPSGTSCSCAARWPSSSVRSPRPR